MESNVESDINMPGDDPEKSRQIILNLLKSKIQKMQTLYPDIKDDIYILDEKESSMP